ncbi:MotA/TolQ/ExbB proton channel family protein [Marinobacterium weihaiense]|uniref:MotA/TolQ/ExbB proton channel family protein n=1 Tax=Marinobacterium weihaiense TaxID=2851016 RepID=A0ABS6M8C2_9GAMM|nr:MotA/TolQ/ExbB proton channel family protein [Marinobacterium weihaiense]MBV0932149.1 MotA/TolQ/ExbB proton channel family protein [Marinobacterium weihaiense]
MFEIVLAGGWLMLPIVACSIVALAICGNRLMVLRPQLIAPTGLLAEVWELTRSGQLSPERLGAIRESSPLGRVIVAGLNNSRHGRDIMKESIQEEASHVIHHLERFLNPLGTIAAITPLLGLLGTVIGMIKVFMEIMLQGTGNASILAGGISEALITTAAGLAVAIPALVMHRYFQRRIDTLVLTMEQESIKLVEAIHGDREVDIH